MLCDQAMEGYYEVWFVCGINAKMTVNETQTCKDDYGEEETNKSQQ